MLVGGVRQWVTFRELDKNTDDFEQVGAAFAAEIGYREAPVGAGTGRLMRQRALVDFAVSWFEQHRVGEASR